MSTEKINRCLQFVADCERHGSIDPAPAFEIVKILSEPALRVEKRAAVAVPDIENIKRAHYQLVSGIQRVGGEHGNVPLELNRAAQILRHLIDDAADLPQGAALTDDWKNDPSADERWNAGVDFAMEHFCKVLGVDPNEVRWDAATETVDGDVMAVIGNIMRAKYGDDWGSESHSQAESAK